MIPIGLYRAEKVKENNRPYVYVKPTPDLMVHPKDRVYVLSVNQPKECIFLFSLLVDMDEKAKEEKKKFLKQGKNEIDIDFTLKSKLVSFLFYCDLERR